LPEPAVREEYTVERASDSAPVILEPKPRLWHRWHLGALVAHLILSLVFTWPLVLNIVPGDGSLVPGVMLEDRDQNLWNLWWVRHALFEGKNPFVTDMIWYPTPVSLYYHTLNLFNGLLAVPLLSLFSLTATYSTIVLFSFVVSGWGAFLLVHYLCGNRWAALVGSVAFAYSAYHIATMRGLLQLISLEWIPFFLLFLLLAVHQPPWQSGRDLARWVVRRALPAGFFLFLVALVDWYYTMYALILAGFLALYYLLRAMLPLARDRDVRLLWKRFGEPWGRIAIVVIVFLVLVSPILVPTLRELRQTSYMQPAPDAALTNSADVMAFFQPTRDQKLWGRFFTNRREWPYGSNRYEVYFTYTALFLTGVGLFAIRARRPVLLEEGAPAVMHDSSLPELPSKWFWAGCTLVFFLLALGPVLQFNGNQIRGLPLPYLLVEKLPVLSISRSPDRFDVPLTLCLAVLVGYGTNVLVRTWRWRSGAGSLRAAFVALGAILLIGVELAPVPYPQRPGAIASWYYQLGKEPGRFSILQLPPQDDYWHGAFRMYDQTAHGKPVFGGYISREFPHPFLRSTPGYQELTYVDGGGDIFATGPDVWYSELAKYATRYIVLEKDRVPVTSTPRPAEELAPSREAIRHVLGELVRPIHEDKDLEVYRVPVPAVRVPFLSIGEGWEPRERREDGVTYRWMQAEASLVVDAPARQEAFLLFKAGAIGRAMPLVIYHGDHKVFEALVEPGVREYRTAGPLGLPQGESLLRLVSPEGTSSPAELGQGDDPRELSFVLFDVKLESVR
jgi:hypothetical protein